MKYLVLHNCYGFQNRYWNRDEIVELNPKSNPPVEHFKPIEEAEPARQEPKPIPTPPPPPAAKVPAKPLAKPAPKAK